MRVCVRLAVGPLVLAAFTLPSWHAAATLAAPQVALDVASQASAVPVASDAVPLGPDEQLVAVRLRVSALVTAGEADALEELIVAVRAPGRRVRVLDYAPRTEMATQVAGTVAVTESNTRDRSASADVKASVHWPFGLGLVEACPTASTAASDHQQRVETYERLPPRELAVASGTTDGGCGAFFKLRGTSQTTLEGAHDLALLLAVPRSWRGDWLAVTLQPRGDEGWGPLVEDDRLAAVTRLVALHLAGDGEAAALAGWLAQAQADFLADVRRHDATEGDAVGELIAARQTPLADRDRRRLRRPSFWDAVLGESRAATAAPATAARQSLDAALTALDELSGASAAPL